MTTTKSKLISVTLKALKRAILSAFLDSSKRNTLDTHMNWVSSKVCMTLAKLKPILGYLNESQRKRIIEAKVKLVALYGSQLILGQPQQVIQRACAILMRINRAMFNNTEGLRSTTSICRRLKIDEPRQDIIKSSLKQIHKIIEAKNPSTSYQT